MAFFVPAAYVSVSAVLTLTGVMAPEHSTFGIILAAVSLVIMPVASLLERATGRELGSATAIADSTQTCATSVGMLMTDEEEPYDPHRH